MKLFEDSGCVPCGQLGREMLDGQKVSERQAEDDEPSRVAMEEMTIKFFRRGDIGRHWQKRDMADAANRFEPLGVFFGISDDYIRKARHFPNDPSINFGEKIMPAREGQGMGDFVKEDEQAGARMPATPMGKCPGQPERTAIPLKTAAGVVQDDIRPGISFHLFA